MIKKRFQLTSATVDVFIDADFSYLEKLVPKEQAFIITDENVFNSHKKILKLWNTIVIKAGEQYKTQETIDSIVKQLIEAGADRTSTLIGVGGGVVTDIAGYVAGVYMRGISFGFVPTTILAMVDAALGGKNGVDVGVYKNMVGLIRQPKFILYDLLLLKSLPQEEWVNGFAEIIKHACIKDSSIFVKLEENNLPFYRKNMDQLALLITRNVQLKMKVVKDDEFETGERKLLNFGHTVGHAIENLYSIPHGHAVSIGMGVACKISENITSFSATIRVTKLLKKYGLPPAFDFDKPAAFKILKSDKKKNKDTIHFILLNKIGKATIIPLPITELETLINSL
jgi:3-dehydroquinate synthase